MQGRKIPYQLEELYKHAGSIGFERLTCMHLVLSTLSAIHHVELHVCISNSGADM